MFQQDAHRQKKFHSKQTGSACVMLVSHTKIECLCTTKADKMIRVFHVVDAQTVKVRGRSMCEQFRKLEASWSTSIGYTLCPTRTKRWLCRRKCFTFHRKLHLVKLHGHIYAIEVELNRDKVEAKKVASCHGWLTPPPLVRRRKYPLHGQIPKIDCDALVSSPNAMTDDWSTSERNFYERPRREHHTYPLSQHI